MLLSCLQSGFLLSYKNELSEVWNSLVLSALLQPSCITDMLGKYSASTERSSEPKWSEEKILPWTEQSGGPREKEGHDASSAERSGSSFLSSFAVYWSLVFHHHLHREEGRLSPQPPQPTAGPPLPFFVMGIKGCTKHWADTTYQVLQPTAFRGFLLVGPPLNSSWFWNGSSMRVSQSWQSYPKPVPSCWGKGGKHPSGEEQGRLPPIQRQLLLVQPAPKRTWGLLWLQEWEGWNCELRLWGGKIELKGEEFM